MAMLRLYKKLLAMLFFTYYMQSQISLYGTTTGLIPVEKAPSEIFHLPEFVIRYQPC